MNIIEPLLATGGSEAPIMLKIIFWVLVILWGLGGIAWRDNPNWIRGNSVVAVILFAILGYYTFGF